MMDEPAPTPLSQSGSQERQTAASEFEFLAIPLMNGLYHTALNMTKDRHAAEDLVQDTYLRAFRHFDGFTRDTNFRAWIYRILTNTYINVYRRKKREPTRVDFETVCATWPEDPPKEFDQNRDFTNTYHELFEDEITLALDRLPDHYRLAVLLRDVQSFSYKEIAEVVACPVGTVMSRLSRGRKMLTKFIKVKPRIECENGAKSDRIC